MRTRTEVLHDHVWKGLRGVVCDDGGNYTCFECGEQWKARTRLAWWPIRIKLRSKPPLRSPSLFGRSYWEVGCDRIEQRVFAHSVIVGRVVVTFGDRRR